MNCLPEHEANQDKYDNTYIYSYDKEIEGGVNVEALSRLFAICIKLSYGCLSLIIYRQALVVSNQISKLQHTSTYQRKQRWL